MSSIIPVLQMPDSIAGPALLLPLEEDSSYSGSEQARLQLLWDKEIKQSIRPVKHDKTAVLLVTWDEGSGDLDTGSEVMSSIVFITMLIMTLQQVNRLAKLFRDKYHFNVKEALLNDKKKAQIQISKMLVDFVYEFDDKHTLLIVYYAGHGSSDQGTDLKLLGQVVHIAGRLRR